MEKIFLELFDANSVTHMPYKKSNLEIGTGFENSNTVVFQVVFEVNSFFQAALLVLHIMWLFVSLFYEFKIWYRCKKVKTFGIMNNGFSLLILTNLVSATVWIGITASRGLVLWEKFGLIISIFFVCFM